MLSKFFNPSSVHNFCHLAKYEFKEIRELDIDSLRKYSKRITAYFAVKDRWVPPFARDQIMSVINTNGGDAIICNEGLPHAFSLGILSPLTSCFCKGSADTESSPWTTDGEENLTMDFNPLSSHYEVSINGLPEGYKRVYVSE
jgi:hypothetical protein